ncbi:MAG: YegS/Rv2252/BmrU family lipid kinase [Chloroflexi bacterium]|nr:YegS/Rv2252/BmrU family lipid kinase [Chloroflexota bacterium]
MLPGRVLLVRNPRARRAPSEGALRQVSTPLLGRGWRIVIRSTTQAGEAAHIASEAAAEGYNAVVAVGGDGTVHELAQGLTGTSTALGVLPAGTANIWATEAGVPGKTSRATGFLARARSVPVDVGRVTFDDGTARRFLLMCSVGLDAEVVRRIGGGGLRKRIFGRAAYIGAGLGRVVRAAPTLTGIEVDGAYAEHDLYVAVVGNTRLYGGITELTSAALADDGQLDVATFSARRFAGRRLPGRLALAARALRGRLDERQRGGVDYQRGAQVRIAPVTRLPVQADGEYIGETPITITVEPRALHVLLDPDPNPLLTGEVE